MSTIYERPLHTFFQRVPNDPRPGEEARYYVMVAGTVIVSEKEVREIATDKQLWAFKEERKHQLLRSLEHVIDEHFAINLLELHIRLNHNAAPRDAQPSREDGVRSADEKSEGNAEPGLKPGSQHAEDAPRSMPGVGEPMRDQSMKDGATPRATSRDKSTYERLTDRRIYAEAHRLDEVRLTIGELREVLDYITSNLKVDLDAAGSSGSQGDSAGDYGTSSSKNPPVAEKPMAAEATSPAQRRVVTSDFYFRICENCMLMYAVDGTVTVCRVCHERLSDKRETVQVTERTDG